MSDDLIAFKSRVERVSYAHETTQRQYDEHPPNDDMVPVASAINAWTLISGCYMGIEQTLKLLIRMRDGTPARTHNLEKLYSSLDPSERKVVATYYRVYRSLHNFDPGSIDLDTANGFIQYIGKGYTAWRYILVETPENVPKMHLGLMLETWRALSDLVQHRICDAGDQTQGGPGHKYWTLADHLEDYIMTVFRAAYSDNEWQAASQDENSDVEFSETCDWLYHKGRPLEAGIDLFDHHVRGTGDSIQASPLLRRVLLRAADKAFSGPLPTGRRADIAMFHHRIRNGGLAWNSDQGVFEQLPMPGLVKKRY